MNDIKELNNKDLNHVAGGSETSDVVSLKLKCIYAIDQLYKLIRDYIYSNPKAGNVPPLKNALNALDLVENDVDAVSSMNDFMFCDRHWGTFKAYIRGAHMEDLFNNTYFIQIEEIIVFD